MLVPAILYKEQIEKEFAKRIYDDKFFFYSGYCHNYFIPEIEASDYKRQYAIINYDDEKVVGYFTYTIDTNVKSIHNLGLYSFDEGNVLIIKEVFNELEKLLKEYHRLEWNVICGNPAERGYDSFCQKHNGTKYIHHDVCIDNHGELHNSAWYEIITDIPAR